MFNFLIQMQWLMEHPQYLLNPVLIVGDSYSGMLAPIISKHILDGNHQTFYFSL